jgi:hypothetical protein
MATGPLRADSAYENPLHSFLVELVKVLDPQSLDAVAEAAIARLDLLDGDTDREGGWTEDDITDDMSRHLRGAFGPGCEMSDPGEYAEPCGGS